MTSIISPPNQLEDEVCQILINLPTLLKRKYTQQDLIYADKHLQEKTRIYNFSKNILNAIAHKYGTKSKEYKESQKRYVLNLQIYNEAYNKYIITRKRIRLSNN
jgi:hypothetical protein